MAFKSIRHFLTISTVLLLLSVMTPSGNARAMTDGLDGTSLPSLETFVEQVGNGQPDELRGVYIAGFLAAPIVQQPVGMDDFVSPWQNYVTQFGMASKYGSTGLLAHNFLAGEKFDLLQEGHEIHLVFGDGRVDTLVVLEILRFQAIDPASTSSTFIDLKTHGRLNYADLFARVYNRPGQVVFQTCIEQNGEPSWGRLFVIAGSSSK
jgi:hypothetical protein